MTLYYERAGHGPDIVLVHGWGLHAGIWSELAQDLSRRHRVTAVDLPGHGRSRGTPADTFTPESLAKEIEKILPGPAVWLGWSLGGLVALAAARHMPQAVAKLVLVGATPKFVQAPDWDCALVPEILDGFAQEIETDTRAALTRFLSLQLGDGEAERVTLRHLRAELFRHGEPELTALRAGLRLLKETDLRGALSGIEAPTLVLHGGRDRLAPPDAARRLAASVRQARLVLFETAGHAPFLSHAAQFNRELEVMALP